MNHTLNIGNQTCREQKIQQTKAYIVKKRKSRKITSRRTNKRTINKYLSYAIHLCKYISIVSWVEINQEKSTVALNTLLSFIILKIFSYFEFQEKFRINLSGPLLSFCITLELYGWFLFLIPKSHNVLDNFNLIYNI